MESRESDASAESFLLKDSTTRERKNPTKTGKLEPLKQGTRLRISKARQRKEIPYHSILETIPNIHKHNAPQPWRENTELN